MTDLGQCCCRFSKEFKEFALQGNILDLAIGIIIGTAFQNVVKSLVDDVITPPFGLIFDGVDFSNLTIKMKNFVRINEPPVVIRYGRFVQQIIHLLIMALALFFVIKVIRRLHNLAVRDRELSQPNEPTVSNEQSEEVKLLREIRDLLASHQNTTNSSSISPSSIDSSLNLITI